MTDPEPTTTADGLEGYFAHCHRRTYQPGATIIAAGDHSNAFFYIVAGSVSVLYEDDDGHEIVLAYLGEGDFFGEIGLFDEKHERSAWVRGRTRCEIAQLSYDRLTELTRSSPDILLTLMSSLCRRLRDTSRKVGELAFMDVAGRIAGALMELSEFPEAVAHPQGVELEITRQELGRIVGCSREMASRVLREMEERGMVTVSGKHIIVHPRARHALPPR